MSARKTCPHCGGEEFIGANDKYPVFHSNDEGGLSFVREEPDDSVCLSFTCLECGEALPNPDSIDID